MNLRNDYFRMILVICFGLFLASCAVPMIEGQKWLDSRNDRPEINISGVWSSPEWGIAIFKQDGKNITGMLGDYPVKGVVSGNSVSLLLYHTDGVHYFAELKALDDNTLNGFYSLKYATLEQNKKPMSLRFISALR
ncbi:MAG: hypothetical protein ACLP9S_00835 [Syntrophales bacterium]